MMMKRSALSRPEKQHRTKGNSMKRLTKSERRKQIRRFDAIRDDQINTTDIPEITEEQMRKGVVGHLYRPIKRPVTMRLDADVIAWLKQGGPGYQTKVNRLLRRAKVKTLRGMPLLNRHPCKASRPQIKPKRMYILNSSRPLNVKSFSS